jgi:hypothetical protein
MAQAQAQALAKARPGNRPQMQAGVAPQRGPFSSQPVQLAPSGPNVQRHAGPPRAQELHGSHGQLGQSPQVLQGSHGTRPQGQMVQLSGQPGQPGQPPAQQSRCVMLP